ncbi:hypothetical protein B0H14DRAFT_2826042 [Mycena olivaceomarginata]|nr:hypothetical protein B0H14DRAFT_2826042 [Mycena olivaceomarginata]
MSSPSLVGGIALRAYDLPGAITFAAAYGLLLPLLVYRLFEKKWRSVIMIQVFFFAVERPVMFSLRAAVAAKPNTESPGLSEYMQATFALGYLTLAEILLRLVRSILVNTTNGTSTADTESHYPAVTQPPPLVSISSGFWKPSLPPPSPSVPNVDDPRRRFWFRRWCEFLLSLYIVAMVLAVVATAHVWKVYISSAIGLVLVLLESCTLLWASKNVPRIDPRATIPPLYRLIVMHNTTPDFARPDHQALNTRTDKAAFYVLHLLPEFAVVAIMSFVERDERCWDETPKEREKRERKERERAEKKEARLELKTRSSNTSSNVSAATLA